MISFILSLAFFAILMGVLMLFARGQRPKPVHAQAAAPAPQPADPQAWSGRLLP